MIKEIIIGVGVLTFFGMFMLFTHNMKSQEINMQAIKNGYVQTVKDNKVICVKEK